MLRASAGPIKNRVLRKSLFFALVIYFASILVLRWLLWEVLGRPQGALRLPRGALGSPKVPFWDPHGLSKWGPFSLLAGFGGPGGFERPPGPIFVCFLWFYQAKLQFSKKNISFTYKRAILGACYAGKSAILKKKHQFYLHSRHLRSILGVCYAGKSDD